MFDNFGSIFPVVRISSVQSQIGSRDLLEMFRCSGLGSVFAVVACNPCLLQEYRMVLPRNKHLSNCEIVKFVSEDERDC